VTFIYVQQNKRDFVFKKRFVSTKTVCTNAHKGGALQVQRMYMMLACIWGGGRQDKGRDKDTKHT
jgi:hypothetical protein